MMMNEVVAKTATPRSSRPSRVGVARTDTPGTAPRPRLDDWDGEKDVRNAIFGQEELAPEKFEECPKGCQGREAKAGGGKENVGVAKTNIEEEREAMAYRKMQEANGGKVQSKRLDWMYDDPVAKQEMKNKKGGEDAFEGTDSKAQGVPSDKEEIEQFLLGKKLDQ